MIRALLGATGRTVRQLGEAVGLNETQMSRRMKGSVPWRAQELVRIATYFGVTPGTLYRDPMESLKTRSETSERAADQGLRVASSRKTPDRRFKPAPGLPLMASI